MMEHQATQEQLERLAGRAVVNSEFRAQLLSAPQETAAEYGVELSEEQVRFVQELDIEAVEELARQMEELFSVRTAAPGW
jgi:hypothetical protein